MRRKQGHQAMTKRERQYCTQQMIDGRDWSFFIRAHIRRDGAVGVTIKSLRTLARMSQISLSKELGIAQSSLSDIETGKYRPSTAMSQQLSEIFGCSSALFD